MNTHPVANLFPPMTDAQYIALREDIRENGQREPITLWRGQVIDGLHRARACEEIGREQLTREWEGEESGLTAYVVSLNLHRRHLNESQRAMVAEKIAFTSEEANKVRVFKMNNTDPASCGSIDLHDKVPREDAARLLNVSVPSVTRARRVRASGTPALIQAVEAGDVSVTRAAEIAKLPTMAQRAALEKSATDHRLLNRHPTRGAMERVDRAIESISNMSEVLTETLPQMNGDKRRPVWASRLRDVRTTLTRFIVECERE